MLAQEVGQHLEVGVGVRLGESPQAQVVAGLVGAPRGRYAPLATASPAITAADAP